MYKPLLVRPLGPTTPGDLGTDTITMVWDVPPWSAFTKVGKSCLLTRFVQVLLNRGGLEKRSCGFWRPGDRLYKGWFKKERSRDSKMNHVFFAAKSFFKCCITLWIPCVGCFYVCSWTCTSNLAVKSKQWMLRKPLSWAVDVHYLQEL